MKCEEISAENNDVQVHSFTCLSTTHALMHRKQRHMATLISKVSRMKEWDTLTRIHCSRKLDCLNPSCLMQFFISIFHSTWDWRKWFSSSSFQFTSPATSIYFVFHFFASRRFSRNLCKVINTASGSSRGLQAEREGERLKLFTSLTHTQTQRKDGTCSLVSGVRSFVSINWNRGVVSWLVVSARS